MQTDEEPDFEAGVAYWDSIEASNNGVLGGHGLADSPVPLLDALSSRLFLLSLRPRLSTVPPPVQTKDSGAEQQQQQSPTKPASFRILDCGAGIGRVTKDVLLPFASHVDILESSAHFLDKAIESCSPIAQAHGKTIRYYQDGMQFFTPASPGQCYAASSQDINQGSGEQTPYDVIWIQWAAGHLSDDQLVAFLQRCRYALVRPNAEEDRSPGLIVVKENNANRTLFDDEDSSISRTDDDFRRCFERAGLVIIKEEMQKGFPKELIPVRTYALEPSPDAN